MQTDASKHSCGNNDNRLFYINFSVYSQRALRYNHAQKKVVREGKNERSSVVKKGTENEKRSRTRSREEKESHAYIHTHTRGQCQSHSVVFLLACASSLYCCDIADIIIFPLIIIAACTRSREILNIFVSSTNNNNTKSCLEEMCQQSSFIIYHVLFLTCPLHACYFLP